eukprot:COSAG02_NODE_10717_length_1874_cov_1.596620_3_plen_197_part_00
MIEIFIITSTLVLDYESDYAYLCSNLSPSISSKGVRRTHAGLFSARARASGLRGPRLSNERALRRQPTGCWRSVAVSEALGACETREHCVAMSAEQQMAFKAWLIDQGNVPAALHARVPTLKPSVDGEWHWNRMTDDPSYAGPTCRPINHFVWKWSETQVTVTNLINAKGGDREESIVLDERCPAPTAAVPPPPPA